MQRSKSLSILKQWTNQVWGRGKRTNLHTYTYRFLQWCFGINIRTSVELFWALICSVLTCPFFAYCAAEIHMPCSCHKDMHSDSFLFLNGFIPSMQQGSRPVRVLQCVWEWVEVWQGVQGRPNCLSARWRRGVPQAPACGRLIKIQTVNQRANGTKEPSGGSTVTAAVQFTQNQMVLRLTATHTHTHAFMFPLCLPLQKC